MSKRRPSEGFTLIELMLVVVIIGILASVVAPHVLKSKTDGLKKAARAQVRNFETAIDMYQLRMDRLPSGLNDLVKDPGDPKWNGPYLKTKSVPKDPWGNRYVFDPEGARGLDYDVYSLGPDGVDGTGDEIGNWVPEEPKQ